MTKDEAIKVALDELMAMPPEEFRKLLANQEVGPIEYANAVFDHGIAKNASCPGCDRSPKT